MKYDILISIKPYWDYKIMKEEKKIEVRKFKITDTNWSGRFVCYVTKDNQSLKRIPEKDRAEFEKYLGKVAFEFTSRNIDELHEWELSPHGRFEEFEQKRLNEFLKDSCLAINEICNYRQKLPYYKPLYGYRVTAPKLYDKPKELWEFRKVSCEFCKDIWCDSDGRGTRAECTQIVTHAPQSYMRINYRQDYFDLYDNGKY
jgi:hypothetical protein